MKSVHKNMETKVITSSVIHLTLFCDYNNSSFPVKIEKEKSKP